MATDFGKERVEHELFVRAFLSTEPPDRVATQLSQAMQDRHLTEGEVLFRRGEVPERLHFIAEGSIQLEAPGTQSWTLEAGSLVGLLDALIPRPRTRCATAMAPTHLLTIDAVDYLDILEDDFGYAVATLAAGARSFCRLAARMDDRRAFRGSERPSNVTQWSATGLDTVERLLVLRRVGWFETTPAQALVELAHLSSMRRFRAGKPLFRAGDRVTSLHVVASGTVVASHDPTKSEVRFGPHRVVTDLAVLGNDVHEWEAVAAEDAVTLELRMDDLFDVAEDHFESCRSMLSYVARERARLSELVGLDELEVGRMTL